jgi:mono/diheme cytochrome c family protein
MDRWEIVPVRQKVRILALATACLWIASLWVRAQAGPQTAGSPPATIDYPQQVHTIFAAKCLSCHSAERRSGGLSLAAYADVLDGGRSGAAIRPANSAGSLLVHRITGEVAPPMPFGRAALSAGEIATIRAWIDEGARETITSPAANPKWEAPLALERPAVPPVVWRDWTTPVDRFVAVYLSEHWSAEPELLGDAAFARRAYLDIWGLLPPPEELQAFIADRTGSKRSALVQRLLADNDKYAQHWISFWNDLLRNDEGVNYYSETSSRKSISTWLLSALTKNIPYDRFVEQLLNPTASEDPDGFLIGVNWRGEVNASQTPAMQAAQNSAQIFIGVNLKCNSCHDSFISKWRLKDAYGLASFFSEADRLRLYRCDVAQDDYATPAFLFPELNRVPPSGSLTDRRKTAAAIFTDTRNGRLPRTMVNRMWHRLLGRGFVQNPDEMDGVPWSPALLDWLASDFVDRGYDLKGLMAAIVSSKAYQMRAVPRIGEEPRTFVFRGPEVRRLSAEQFGDAIGAITGDWNVYQPPAPTQPARGTAAVPTGPPPGRYTREWQTPASSLARALGRPIRDQVFSTRNTVATTVQALELVNGERLTNWLLRGARNMLGELPPPPTALFLAPINSRGARAGQPPQSRTAPAPFDIDISGASRLWFIVQDANSTAVDKAEAVWARGELVRSDGTVTPLTAFTPLDNSVLRSGYGPVLLDDATFASGVRVKTPSRLVYDISGRGFTRLRGVVGLENVSNLAQGETILGRFLIFGTEPDMDRLVPPTPGTPLPPGPRLTTPAQVVNRVYWYALGRAPSADERTIALEALSDPARPGRISAEGLADLLWAVLMKPEFQLIF